MIGLSDLRLADPDQADSVGQRELIIALLNLTEQVMRVAAVIEERP